MSLLKWTLAAAGTAMGMRYMSDRHRRRIAEGGGREAQTDRDDGRTDTPWSTAQGESGLSTATGGTGTSIGTGLGTGLGAGSSTAGSGASSFEQDDLLSPDSDRTPGGSTNRF